MKIKTELQELRSKNKKELFSEMQEAQKKLTELRLGQAFRKLKNYKEINKTRKKIARLWTILTEKTLEEQDGKEKNEPQKN